MIEGGPYSIWSVVRFAKDYVHISCDRALLLASASVFFSFFFFFLVSDGSADTCRSMFPGGGGVKE